MTGVQTCALPIYLVVGLIFGMVLRAEDFTTALQTYAVLTIGDGLLSQMPSLLVSFATGLIVTRSASDGKTTLGASFKKEFAQNAWIYYVAERILLEHLGNPEKLEQLTFI